ncbi:DUF680 domain-containing protein [Mesorhizobium sp. B2-1-8]|uniref:DUF680 domain-containing protein n=1 Tax=Mesorhizobium sp. B2-1-8 TaxID=2589967 RepID=UPI00112A8095|nr:DUF680 domain-containing protein [Mesorhizobium sp. B2-1-8]UCI19067.1 DUF680 domain-containing protein [Mesorhizobium sp. B2-1-8]
MKTTVLTAAVLLVSAGGAFAGSDHYGSDRDLQPAAVTDYMHTRSTKKTNNDADVRQTVRKPMIPNDEYGQGIWGR